MQDGLKVKVKARAPLGTPVRSEGIKRGIGGSIVALSSLRPTNHLDLQVNLYPQQGFSNLACVCVCEHPVNHSRTSPGEPKRDDVDENSTKCADSSQIKTNDDERSSAKGEGEPKCPQRPHDAGGVLGHAPSARRTYRLPVSSSSSTAQLRLKNMSRSSAGSIPSASAPAK